jgi:transposase-like protein
MPIIQGQILEGSTVHTDGWKAYDGLILNGYDHDRVQHSENEFARGKSHVNGIDAFWSFAKRRLAKFNGCASKTFMLHLKNVSSVSIIETKIYFKLSKNYSNLDI